MGSGFLHLFLLSFFVLALWSHSKVSQQQRSNARLFIMLIYRTGMCITPSHSSTFYIAKLISLIVFHPRRPRGNPNNHLLPHTFLACSSPQQRTAFQRLMASLVLMQSAPGKRGATQPRLCWLTRRAAVASLAAGPLSPPTSVMVRSTGHCYPTPPITTTTFLQLWQPQVLTDCSPRPFWLPYLQQDVAARPLASTRIGLLVTG